MISGTRIKFCLYACLGLLCATVLIALVATDYLVGMMVATIWPYESVSHELWERMYFVYNLFALNFFLLAVHWTIGFGGQAIEELKDIWSFLPKGLHLLTRVLGVVVFLVNVNAFIIWAVGTFSVTVVETYTYALSSFLPDIVVVFSAWKVNLVAALYAAILLIFCHLRLPEWRRLPLSSNLIEGQIGSGLDLEASSDEVNLQRKAERCIEKGQLLKAARLFESLGKEFWYRAGKLYIKKGQEKKAIKAFTNAGEYYLKRENYTRAGDAFFFGNQWERAIEAYERYVPPQAFLTDRELIVQWVKRWGESLNQLGRFQEAAELFDNYELHTKAGEAFEKAEMPTSAAEAYGRAGAYESSFRALQDSGHVDLAAAEKGKHYLQRGEFLDAAQEFEKGKQFLLAAEAFVRAGVPGRAARCFSFAQKPDRAAELFLEAGEELLAINCYELMEDYDKAAQLAAHLGLQDRQAFYYEKGGHLIPAARAYLMIYQTDDAVRCLEQVELETEALVAECDASLFRLFQQNRLTEALSCAYALLEGKKTKRIYAPLLFTLARIHEKTGKREKASQFYFQAANLVPANTEYIGNAKRIARKLGLSQGPRTKTTAIAGNSIAGWQQPVPEKPVAMDTVKQDVKPVYDEVEATLTLDEQSIYDLTEGGALERYQVIKELGHGGMGFVYKARDKKLKRFVALKMLHPEMNDDPRILLFFKREAHTIASLNHPNIVQLYDMGKERGCFYMVMEYIHGRTLKVWVKKRPAVVRKYLIPMWLQVCTGLKYAHGHGIVHRDIKPSNIMFTSDSRLKILDFGLAKGVADLNQTKQLWGTPSFMAPELFHGERAGFHTDIYGLGATFYMLATRQEPFNAKTLNDKFIGDGLPKSPQEVDPRISQDLAEVILNCMQLQPEKRFQSVAELISRIKKL